MMGVLGLLAAVALGGAPGKAASAPVLWLNPAGTVLVEGKRVAVRLTKGAKTVETPFGLGLDLDGTRGGLLLADAAPLALTDALTVSTWVYLRSYVNDGPGAQILFRGDDRAGLDPYALVLHGDGRVCFGVNDSTGASGEVSSPITLKRWVHVTASFDAATGEMKLWIDGRLEGTASTERRPFVVLDRGSAPGIGIGNVQNDRGPHNQPLNGTIADLRLYGAALSPAAAGWRPIKTPSAG